MRLMANIPKSARSPGRSSGTRRPYPTGVPHQLTNEWKRLVDDWLDRHGHNRQWLSRAIPADRTTVDATLDPIGSGGSATSKLVPRICEITDLRPPVRAANLEMDDAMEVFAKLDGEQLAALVDFARKLAPKKK